MYSKHRQKNAKIPPALCRYSLIVLFVLLLNGVLESAYGDTREQGKEKEAHACCTKFSLFVSTSCVRQYERFAYKIFRINKHCPCKSYFLRFVC